MLFPTECPLCGRAGEAPCRACRRRLVPAGELVAPRGLDALVAGLRYESAGRDLLHALKYRNRRASVAWLGRVLAVRVRQAHLEVGLVTWAPTSVARRVARGFDQAELLARAVARELRLPVRGLLRRLPSGPQTGRSAVARLRGPVCIARWPGPSTRIVHRSRAVLLVDDVCTTGATLSAAALTLQGLGLGPVVGAVAAHTPLKPGVPQAENSGSQSAGWLGGGRAM